MTNYKKGARKEYKIIYDLQKEGYSIAQRAAGSHSPIDIFAINREKRIIKFIQSKRTINQAMSYIDEALKKKIETEMFWLNGDWLVLFEVR